MVRLLLIFSTVAALSLASCSSDTMELESQVTVLDHSECDSDEGALIKLEAIGGTAPYVFTIWDQTDYSQIHSFKSEENVVIVGKKDLRSIDYTYILTDSDGVQLEENFKVIPQGSSNIKSQLIMQNAAMTQLPENIEIQLIKASTEGVIIESTFTDSEGRYQFMDLTPGKYTLEVFLKEKYDDYVLLSNNENSKLRIEPGKHITRPFSLACSESFSPDLVITN